MKHVFTGLTSILVAALCILASTSVPAAVPGTMSYQGRLTTAAGQNVTDGNYSVRLTLYDAASSGTVLWAETLSVAVTSGLFSVQLGAVHPLDASKFSSSDRWLGTAVGSDAELSPRAKLTTVAYAFQAGGTTSSYLPLAGGVMTGPITNTGNPTITMGKGNFGTGNTNAGADAFVAGNSNSASSQFASVSGGAGNLSSGSNSHVGGGLANRASATDATVAGGTSDTASGLYSAVGGGEGNAATYGHCTVAGGNQNKAGAEGAFVGGGSSNLAIQVGTVVTGGSLNVASTQYSTIGGGFSDSTSGDYATVGGGERNAAAGPHATVAGGVSNKASYPASTVGGGESNAASSQWTTVAGGYQNSASGQYAAVGGGDGNASSYLEATVAGGHYNKAANSYASVGGGYGNQATGTASSVSGGNANLVSGDFAAISGGNSNIATSYGVFVGSGRADTANGTLSVIGGGLWNKTGESFFDSCSTVGGGRRNYAKARYSTVGGGVQNTANWDGATVGGGLNNTASGYYATVPGGVACAASADYTFAAGSYTNAKDAGSFVWGDNSTSAILSSYGVNTFSARCAGGARFYSNAAMTSGVQLLAGAGGWSNLSDRNAKANFQPADGAEILDRLDAIDLSTWNYKSQPDSIRHMGPMAQDFYRAFGLGEDSLLISTVDADGVALVAIKELNRKVKEIDQLKRQNETLLRRLEALEAVVGKGGASR